MADTRLHDKFHGTNHHTLSTAGFPDSASDPIASKDYPFKGDFYITGGLSASHGLSANDKSYISSNEGTTLTVIYSGSDPAVYVRNSGTGNAITTNGSISSSDVIYANGGNSIQWNTASLYVLASSQYWNAASSVVIANSANWILGYNLITGITGVSSNWNSSYTTLTTNSGYWDSAYTTLRNVSGRWESVYNNSLIWEAAYNTISSGSARWDSSYNTISSLSSGWQSNTSTVSTNSARWESVYSTVETKSAYWDSNYTTVNTKSGRWESTYTTLCTNSAYDKTPTGTVMAFATSAAPFRWLKCNGAEYDITAYPDLYSVIGRTFTPILDPIIVDQVKLLTLQSNAFQDNSVNNYTLTATGSPIITAFAPFPNSYSVYFNGNNYISIPKGFMFEYDEDLTIEFWIKTSVYDLDNGINRSILTFGPSGMVGVATLILRLETDGKIGIATISNQKVVGPMIADNQWHHIAVTLDRAGFIGGNDTVRIFVDGIPRTPGTIVNRFINAGLFGRSCIGSYDNTTSGGFVGYISNLRLTIGRKLYNNTTSFTLAQTNLANNRIGDLPLKFKVPDLRGRFVRGWADGVSINTNKNNDAGRSFGSYQDDSFQGHWHLFTRYLDINGPPNGTGVDAYGNASDGNAGVLTSPYPSTVYDTGHGTPRQGDETRPANVALLYCIKW